ncbi:hypothetical protein T10_692 [Trichinella papuae]|uniref:Uncharacterized protein n=1 Tax=Trichinella papuae TaxID=268474 RepID=A0A0V1N7S1_9BILA|nr:hypothetical protein T10_692 [Trichinella papuae]
MTVIKKCEVSFEEGPLLWLSIYSRPSKFTDFKTTPVCMHAVDLQVQCKLVFTYEVPHHNSSDNDLTKLGG